MIEYNCKKMVSICIPCYRSAKTLPSVVDGIRNAFAEHPEFDYQILLANDGSPDDTFAVIRTLCAQDHRIQGFDLTRNYGQNQALCALYDHIGGDMAVFMDDDGQHPTEGIFLLLEKIEEGYDVAIAEFRQKKHTYFKRVTSRLQRDISEWAGTCPHGIVYSSFTAWSSTAIAAAKQYHSPYPSIGAYLMNVSTRFINVPMPHQKRLEGQSGYTLKKLVSLSLTALTSFSIRPLRIASLAGLAFASVGFISGIVIVIRKLIRPAIAAGYTSMMAVQLLIGGILMLLLGLIGEYLGRIYMTISGKPQYLIREELNTTENQDVTL